MFLATFLIGLREGLEATIIVGVLAAFLRRNEKKTTSVLVGALLAVLISIAVGVGLMLSAQSLPQAQQEALETIIGIIAVAFVTTMILWMNKHARAMKSSLEAEAELSMSKGGTRALAGMSFLAVLKEGFETAVFLLAALNAGGNALQGISGAVLGIAAAIVLGYLIYYGGVKFNLSAFFKITGPFLILVAAGFVANAFRTGHEAGWVNIGQAQVFDFSSLINNESIVGAIIQGMFSIQSDPRLIEVMGWFAYLVPVLIIYLWPARFSFTFEQAQRIRLGFAAILAAIAVALAIFFPKGNFDVVDSTQTLTTSAGEHVVASIVSQSDEELVVSIDGKDVVLKKVREGLINNAVAYTWEAKEEVARNDLPSSITLAELTTLNNDRLPSGINRQRHTGPFEASWSQLHTYTATTVASGLVSISKHSIVLGKLSAGGLSTSKLVSIAQSTAGDQSWETPADVEKKNKDDILQAWYRAEEYKLWWLVVPVSLLAISLGLIVAWGYYRKSAPIAATTSIPKKQVAVT